MLIIKRYLRYKYELEYPDISDNYEKVCLPILQIIFIATIPKSLIIFQYRFVNEIVKLSFLNRKKRKNQRKAYF
jgi:regulatory protein YycH of two-component signal transduction system YycFG